ncbi:guanosine-3 -bis 3 -pyrophosphohydrolase [Lasius niger]|uniref:Guanosine-3-bis 3-pyrophosphohydrolase n=1 Tax=Lasius niger TaxID=67767 RepID=A0A0J7NHV4_LASNI|nr:guanosine-3 -bis 3 -pyrophosphohydrolase [Lasius niger]
MNPTVRLIRVDAGGSRSSSEERSSSFTEKNHRFRAKWGLSQVDELEASLRKLDKGPCCAKMEAPSGGRAVAFEFRSRMIALDKQVRVLKSNNDQLHRHLGACEEEKRKIELEGFRTG